MSIRRSVFRQNGRIPIFSDRKLSSLSTYKTFDDLLYSYEHFAICCPSNFVVIRFLEILYKFIQGPY